MTTLDGSHLTFDDVRRVARENHPVEIAPSSVAAMERSRAVVERLAAADEPVYGSTPAWDSWPTFASLPINWRSCSATWSAPTRAAWARLLPAMKFEP